MVSSQSSHFPSLILTTIQRGAFGGLLLGRESVDNRPTNCVARSAKPAKRLLQIILMMQTML
jgi:hypothetical protein